MVRNFKSSSRHFRPQALLISATKFGDELQISLLLYSNSGEKLAFCSLACFFHVRCAFKMVSIITTNFLWKSLFWYFPWMPLMQIWCIFGLIFGYFFELFGDTASHNFDSTINRWREKLSWKTNTKTIFYQKLKLRVFYIGKTIVVVN